MLWLQTIWPHLLPPRSELGRSGHLCGRDLREMRRTHWAQCQGEWCRSHLKGSPWGGGRGKPEWPGWTRISRHNRTPGSQGTHPPRPWYNQHYKMYLNLLIRFFNILKTTLYETFTLQHCHRKFLPTVWFAYIDLVSYFASIRHN